MKLTSILLAGVVSISSIAPAIADQVATPTTATEVLTQAGSDAQKAAEETVVAIKLALAATEDAVLKSTEETAIALQKLEQDVVLAAKQTEVKVVAANAAVASGATDLMTKAETAAKKSLAAAEEANQRAVDLLEATAKSDAAAIKVAAENLKAATAKSAAAAVDAVRAANEAAKETWNKDLAKP